MATGFDKLKSKIMDESPITLNTVNGEKKDNSQEERQVEKLSRASRVGESSRIRREEVKPAASVEPEEDLEKLFQITIKIKQSTKDKLDWLKFSQKKKFMELAEEAFEDIYNKYRK